MNLYNWSAIVIFLALVINTLWIIKNPSHEPLITWLGLFGVLIGLLIKQKNKNTSVPIIIPPKNSNKQHDSGFINNDKEFNIDYKEDSYQGAKWRWEYIENEIKNFRCFCPQCDMELVPKVIFAEYHHSALRTKFICENCNNKVIASIDGGDRHFTVEKVKREIERRIRTKEYKNLPG